MMRKRLFNRMIAVKRTARMMKAIYLVISRKTSGKVFKMKTRCRNSMRSSIAHSITTGGGGLHLC